MERLPHIEVIGEATEMQFDETGYFQSLITCMKNIKKKYEAAKWQPLLLLVTLPIRVYRANQSVFCRPELSQSPDWSRFR
jgi:hypothetical protein